MMSRLKNSAGPTSLAAAIRIWTRGCSGLCALEMLVRVFDHHDRRVDHRPDRNGDAAKAHDVGAETERFHRGKSHQHADWKHQDGDERAAHMQKKQETDERDDQAFFQERVPQIFDRGADQRRAIVNRLNIHAFRQAAGQLGQAVLDVVDDLKRVGAEALQHDAARHFAVAVELGEAAPFVGAELDPRDVLKQHRRTAVVLEHDLSQIGNAFQIAAAAHHEFKFGQLHRAAAEIHVAGADRAAHLGQRNIEAAQALRIDHHVVLFDEAADAGDLGNALRLGEAVAERPVLQRAQFGERSLLGDQRILVDPADAGGIGTEARRHARSAARAPRR